MPGPVEPRIVTAVNQWAQGVFGAPKRFEQLIDDVRNSDECVERVATRRVRRELKPAFGRTAAKDLTAPRVSGEHLDPFAYSLESLRAATEQVTGCAPCSGTGKERCPTCGGGGMAACRQCGGAGSFRNPSTNRMNQCKACKKTGRVECPACDATGTTGCSACSGSGHVLRWLTFEEKTWWDVSTSKSEIVGAHRFLTEARPVARNELNQFAIEAFVESGGPISEAEMQTHRVLIDDKLAAVDQRLERVTAQQYVRLAVVRRDVTFTTCGKRGLLVLSGNSLKGASTQEAVAPIKRRVWMTVAAAVGVGAALGVALLALAGRSEYFDRINSIAIGLSVGAVVFVVPLLLGVLRSWGSPRGRSSMFERAAGALALAAAVASVGLLVLGRPTVADANAALDAKDVRGATEILAALRETSGDVPQVRDVEDRLLLLEASSLSGEERFKRLDEVAGHGGKAAADATATARHERLALVDDDIKQHKAYDAVASLDRWWPKTNDPDVLEARARAFEAEAQQCSTMPCRLSALNKATSSHGNEQRNLSAQKTRTELDAALTPPATADRDVLTHLRRAKEIESLATEVTKSDLDEALKHRAAEAATWVGAERAKVAEIGASIDVLDLLVGPLTRLDTASAKTQLSGGLDAYFALDAQARCVGVYVVGAANDQRLFVSSDWPAQRVIGQAIGRPVQTIVSATDSGVKRWFEGGVPIVARFVDRSLVELRIGQATP